MCIRDSTYIAPFVNAEECEYLVVEDRFPNGRPPLEKAGVMFADRQTVEQVERMKVSTCLNPVHTGLAVFGCLLGFTKISAEMQDPDLKPVSYTHLDVYKRQVVGSVATGVIYSAIKKPSEEGQEEEEEIVDLDINL